MNHLKFKKQIGLFSLWLLLSGGSLLASSLSYSRPAYYSFSGLSNNLYSHADPYSGVPEGHILHFEYKSFLPIGVESYKVYISESNTEEDKSYIEINFIDIMYRFKYKNLNLFGGFGYGSIQYNCKISACRDYSFKSDTARQFFFQLGIPITDNIDLHLSGHSVVGSNEVTIGNRKDNINLGGSMAAFGLLIKW